MDDDDLTMGPWIDYGGSRTQYVTCTGKGCPVRWRTGKRRACCWEHKPLHVRQADLEALAAKLNSA